MIEHLVGAFAGSGWIGAGLVAWGGLHLLLAVGQVVAARRVDVVVLLWSVPVVTLLGGALATQVAMVHAYSAVAAASVDSKDLLLHVGMAAALRPSEVAVLVAMVQLVVAGTAHSLRRSMGTGRPIEDRPRARPT